MGGFASRRGIPALWSQPGPPQPTAITESLLFPKCLYVMSSVPRPALCSHDLLQSSSLTLNTITMTGLTVIMFPKCRAPSIFKKHLLIKWMLGRTPCFTLIISSNLLGITVLVFQMRQ